MWSVSRIILRDKSIKLKLCVVKIWILINSNCQTKTQFTLLKKPVKIKNLLKLFPVR
jgi:hypothetical protein